MAGENWTTMEVLNWTVKAFQERGFSSARLEAEVLLSHVLGMERIGLYAHFDRPLSAGERGDYRELVRRRFSGEPSQYLTGVQEFWSLEFKVSPAVLVPRPDTEILVDECVSFLKARGGTGKVLDVGTGSGAIAVALASEFPEVEVFACDISADALAVATENNGAHGDKVTLVEGPVENGLAAAGGVVDLLVSNPPYIPTATLSTLMQEVRDHEPRLALDGGADGLVVIRQILEASGHGLAEGGGLFFEVEGDRQASEVVKLIEDVEAFERVALRKDYAGIDRVVYGVGHNGSHNSTNAL